jgi:hypothetical protein
MKLAHDIYSETNPEFCAYALVGFTAAYITMKAGGPELPTAYLALPVVLYGNLSGTFDGTNKNTGLLEWLERNPQVQVSLAERVNASMEIVTNAIRFGCFARMLKIAEGARLSLGNEKIKRKAVTALSDQPAEVLKRCERLGYWFALAGSTRVVFDMMGLTL